MLNRGFSLIISMTALILCALSSSVIFEGGISSAAAVASDLDAALRILDERTSLRWGEDNLAWVVHYPAELVDPWVNAEAEKRKFLPDQKETYKKSFIDDLRIGSATAILFTVHAYGSTPITLTPLSQNITLIDSAGKRVGPMVIEKKLDLPISGLVQGFIYFPLQRDKNFKIAVKGLIRDQETVFSFEDDSVASAGVAIKTAPVPTPKKPAEKPQEVVVKVPPAKPVAPVAPQPPASLAISHDQEFIVRNSETFSPTRPAVTSIESLPELPAVSSLDFGISDTEGDMADISNLIKERQEQRSLQAPSKTFTQPILDAYLKAWMEGDTATMYAMLSSKAKSTYSQALFAREIASASFRNSLKSGYRIDWISDTSAKVTASSKLLFIRSLESKVINFVEENGEVRVDL